MAMREKSGVLTLRRGPLEKEIVFDSGAVVECHSNIATETLGRFLVASGRINEAQYHDALAVAAARGLTLAELLVERTILSPADLTRAGQQNLGRKLLEPFHWTRGSWHLSFDMPRIDVVYRVRVPQLIITGILKVEPLDAIQSALSEAATMPLGVSSTPPFDLSELRLSEEQQRVVARIREGAALADLRGAAESEELDRFVFALLFLGLAGPRERVAQAASYADSPAPPPQEAVAPSPALGPVATPEQLNAATQASDAFELLGLDATANAMAITRAFLRMAEQTLPARYEERERGKAQEVFLAIVRAYNELADPVRRQALLDKRVPTRTLGEATQPSPPPELIPSKPRRAIIDPEELYRQGRDAAAAGKLRDALGYFEMAAECDIAWTLVGQAAQGVRDLDSAIEQTKLDVRHYAKRQLTWFRHEAGVEWFDGFGEENGILRSVLETVAAGPRSK